MLIWYAPLHFTNSIKKIWLIMGQINIRRTERGRVKKGDISEHYLLVKYLTYDTYIQRFLMISSV